MLCCFHKDNFLERRCGGERVKRKYQKVKNPFDNDRRYESIIIVCNDKFKSPTLSFIHFKNHFKKKGKFQLNM